GTEDNPRAFAFQNDYKDFYNKLWLLDIPSKIKITVWKISWNFLATRVNLVFKKLANTTTYPRARLPNVEYFAVLYGLSGEIEMLGPKAPITVKKWRKPPDRMININFDAAYDGRQKRSTVGIVVRDSEGSALLSCSEIHHRITSVFIAEAVACRKAIQTGIGMKWASIIIESDSLSIIRKCKKKNPDESWVSAYINDIHQLRQKLKECSFEFVPRSANNLAHIIAKETLKRNEGVYLVGKVPEAAEAQAAC
ncbi:hypothetical protein Goarm_003982, partial [Gossypium armourianum]|nr:hypothetical protein [Gossypium armourianum]